MPSLQCLAVYLLQQHHWWAQEMKAEFPAALLITPSGLKEKKPQLPIDIEIGTLSCTTEDLPDSWPFKDIDMTPVSILWGCSSTTACEMSKGSASPVQSPLHSDTMCP